MDHFQLLVIHKVIPLKYTVSNVHDLALAYYRQDAAKRQTAGIKFTHRPKIRFFAQQG